MDLEKHIGERVHVAGKELRVRHWDDAEAWTAQLNYYRHDPNGERISRVVSNGYVCRMDVPLRTSAGDTLWVMMMPHKLLYGEREEDVLCYE